MPFKIGLARKRKEKLEKELKRIVPILIKLGVRKIVLFGSLAKGEVHKSSDCALFIIMETDKNFMERIDEIYKACKPRVAIDFFIYTPDEIKNGLVSSILIREVEKYGKVLYEKE